jgi:hypothetical protein
VDLHQIRQQAEVQALAESVGADPSPIFTLVVHPRVEVRMAGLCALEYRTRWLTGQPRYLLGLLANAQEPEIKSAILLALACSEDRSILEAMCEYLWDPNPEVRRAAVQALLWNTEDRWIWIQTAFRQALNHPTCALDGPLISPGMVLRPEVLVDLVSWTAEKGILAQRAAMTLGIHYDQLLRQGANITELRDLEQQVVNPQTPAFWRLEIARLLGQHREVSQEVAQTLLNPSNPAPLRLLAVETLLGKSSHQQALSVLVEVARLPNREMALAAAEIVQRRLNIHLGLDNGHALPPTHTRQAAEIVRNVLLWADRQEAAWSHVPAGRSYDDDF